MLAVLQNLAMSLKQKINGFGSFYMKNFCPKLVEVLRKGYDKDKFRRDTLAGMTVAVVSIPLAMALAIASGVTPAQGLYTAIVAGFFIALLGGSKYQIGGPTGAFVVVIFNVIKNYGPEGLTMTMLVAGIILIIAGLLRLGTYIKYIPYPVVTGFTAGIGALLISTQVKDLLGLQMEASPLIFFPNGRHTLPTSATSVSRRSSLPPFRLPRFSTSGTSARTCRPTSSPSSAPRCWSRYLRCSPPRRIPSAPNSVPFRTSCLRRNCRNLTSI